MCQVHRHLPGTGDFGTPSCRPAQIAATYSKNLRDCVFNHAALEGLAHGTRMNSSNIDRALH